MDIASNPKSLLPPDSILSPEANRAAALAGASGILTIDLEALVANWRKLEKTAVPAECAAVVKANAYGHGAVTCARRLASEGAEWFAVAMPEEGIELRRAGITQPILCLSGFWAGQEQLCLTESLVPLVYRLDMIEALDRAAGDQARTVKRNPVIDRAPDRHGHRQLLARERLQDERQGGRHEDRRTDGFEHLGTDQHAHGG